MVAAVGGGGGGGSYRDQLARPCAIWLRFRTRDIHIRDMGGIVWRDAALNSSAHASELVQLVQSSLPVRAYDSVLSMQRPCTLTFGAKPAFGQLAMHLDARQPAYGAVAYTGRLPSRPSPQEASFIQQAFMGYFDAGQRGYFRIIVGIVIAAQSPASHVIVLYASSRGRGFDTVREYYIMRDTRAVMGAPAQRGLASHAACADPAQASPASHAAYADTAELAEAAGLADTVDTADEARTTAVDPTGTLGMADTADTADTAGTAGTTDPATMADPADAANAVVA